MVSLTAAATGPVRAGEAMDWRKAPIAPLQECGPDAARVSGTDTCIRFGGNLRATASVRTGSLFKAPSGQGGSPRSIFRQRGSVSVNVDTRTPTEFGPIRAFASVRVTGSPLLQPPR